MMENGVIMEKQTELQTIKADNTESERRLRAVGWIYYGVLLSLTVFRIIIYQWFSGLSTNVLEMVFTAVTQILLMGLLPFTLYLVFVARGNAKERLTTVSNDFGYNPKLSPSIYVATIMIGLLLFFANYGASYASTIALRLVGYTFNTPTPTMMPDVGSMLMWMFFTAVLPACFEELSHRGLVLSAYRDLDVRSAVIISALTFALMHQNIIQTFYAFIAGLILGSIACYTRSIIPSMIIHFMNNAMGVLLDYSEQHGGKFYSLFLSVFSDITVTKLLILIAAWAVAYYAIVRLLRQIKAYCTKEEAATDNYFKTTSKSPFGYSGMIMALSLGAITTLITLIWGIAR